MEKHGVFWVNLGIFEVEEFDFVIIFSKIVLFYHIFVLTFQHLGTSAPIQHLSTCSAPDSIFGCWVPALIPLSQMIIFMISITEGVSLATTTRFDLAQGSHQVVFTLYSYPNDPKIIDKPYDLLLYENGFGCEDLGA